MYMSYVFKKRLKLNHDNIKSSKILQPNTLEIHIRSYESILPKANMTVISKMLSH